MFPFSYSPFTQPSVQIVLHFFFFLYSSVDHVVALSDRIRLSVSCLSASRRMGISPGGIAPQNTPLALGTVKLQRLPLNLGKCRAQTSYKLLNNQCVPIATGACTVLASKAHLATFPCFTSQGLLLQFMRLCSCTCLAMGWMYLTDTSHSNMLAP